MDHCEALHDIIFCLTKTDLLIQLPASVIVLVTPAPPHGRLILIDTSALMGKRSNSEG
jgi:hypothetical protein